MYVASGNGHTDVVSVLVKAGADVNEAITEVLSTVTDLLN